MKYKLININTNEEVLCDKITINNFDYYVSDELPKDNEGYWIYIGFNEPLEVVKSNQPQGWFEKLWDKANYKTPIATNNPNINIPVVIDKVEKLANEFAFCYPGSQSEEEYDSKLMGYYYGYNKSQETHPFSKEDVIDFLNWIRDHTIFDLAPKPYLKKTQTRLPQEELLKLWQEQQSKIIYYGN